ncbi:MAG: DUF4331 family protein [Thermoplasmata archaeon]
MADHTDPPAVAGLRDRDITDIYAFHPPRRRRPDGQRLNKTVLVLAVNPLSPPGDQQSFSDDAEYKLLVDTDGDADDDIEIEFAFEEREGRNQEFEFEIEGDDWEIEGEGRTNRVIRLGGGVKVFAGLRDDPFFFDLEGFLAGFAFTGVDFFAGSNVSAIVLEVPTRTLTPDGPEIGVWGAIEGSDQIDRMGRPAISTALIPTDRKDLYNASEPEDDVEKFRDDVIATITALGNPSGAAALADFLLPDILTLDASKPTAFPNGRNLADDVMDTVLDLVVPGAFPMGDGVDENDKGFRRRFPYLAPPHR